MSRSAPRPAPTAKTAAKKPALFANAPADFTAAFYNHLLPADLALFSSEERARIAASIWALAATRRPDESKVRVFNPSPQSDGWTVDHTVVEVVGADMPFLVASVTGVLQRAGYAVHMVIHPVVRIRRDAKGNARRVVLKENDTNGALARIFHTYSNRPLPGT